MTPIELTVEPQDEFCFRVFWYDNHGQYHDYRDGDWRKDDVVLANVPLPMLDLVPFMAARKLIDYGYDPNRLLIVRIRGGDLDMLRAPLGLVAAPPQLGTQPITASALGAWRVSRLGAA
jgi:hypothetical protein